MLCARLTLTGKRQVRVSQRFPAPVLSLGTGHPALWSLLPEVLKHREGGADPAPEVLILLGTRPPVAMGTTMLSEGYHLTWRADLESRPSWRKQKALFVNSHSGKLSRASSEATHELADTWHTDSFIPNNSVCRFLSSKLVLGGKKDIATKDQKRAS